ncbi:MAG: hypothetical protein JF612_06780, partial [Planctomycetia bacterium]|nr:hypothetical protein [Planctomycetia bacterium]
MAKTSSATEVKLASNYESLRNQLKKKEFQERLDRPLAFWALPSDRRLPNALLKRTLRDLFNHSFEELATTAGIGRKKLEMFIKLLVRATKEDAEDAKVENLPGADEVPATGLDEKGRFDPLRVSEMVWVKWR